MIKADLDALDYNEVSTRDEIDALQLHGLKWTLSYGYANDAGYRALFDAAGVDVDTLEIVADIVKFPLNTDAHPAQIGLRSALPSAEIDQIQFSRNGGSVLPLSTNDVSLQTQLCTRALRGAGVWPSDRVLCLRDACETHFADAFARGAQRLGACVVSGHDLTPDAQMRRIEMFEVGVVLATPRQMLLLLEAYHASITPPADSPIKLIILTGAATSEALRYALATAFNAELRDTYSNFDVLGTGIAQECVGHDGLVVWEDHILVEVIDPKTTEVVAPGEWGELVLTTLSNEAHVQLRHRTGDVTRMLPMTDRPMQRIDHIPGRIADMLTVNDVTFFPIEIEAAILDAPGLLPFFQLSLNPFTIHVEALPDVADEEVEILQAALSRDLGVEAIISTCALGTSPARTSNCRLIQV